MATPPPDASLAQVYRRSQLALRANTLRDVLRLWPLLRMDATAATYPAWLAAMRTLVERDREMSRSSTAAYLATAWAAAGLTGAPDLPSLDFPVEQVDTSLRVTSLVAYRRGLGLGMSPSQANENALVQVSGAASRLVLEAGRETALAAVDNHRARWARITSPTACKFCTMLAGRGFVYRSDETVSFAAHDHCACTAAVDFSAAQAAA